MTDLTTNVVILVTPPLPAGRALRDAREYADNVLAQVFDRARSGDVDLEALSRFTYSKKHLARLTGWREPDERARRITNGSVEAAIRALRRLAADRQVLRVPTEFGSLPYAEVDFSGSGEPLFDFAPLVDFCCERALVGRLVLHLTQYHSSFTRGTGGQGNGPQPHDLYRGRSAALLERLNVFLVVEWRLWKLARLAGYSDPIPYAVRYYANRFLWGPEAIGLALCLRCGDEITYKRADPGKRRVPVCRACVHARSTNWPAHAIAPHDSGLWWLTCLEADCGLAFIGRPQRRYCPAHGAEQARQARHRQRRS